MTRQAQSHGGELAHPAGTTRVVAWGRLGYRDALERQLELWQRRLVGAIGDTIACVEHPPTVTLGRHAPASDVTLDTAELERRGIDVVRTDRGGRATYHGVGQAVVYPIVALAEHTLGTRQWVALIERTLLDTLASYGIEGRLVCGRPGIWVGDAKIASIGLRIARGVSYHGLALNVGPDVGGFDCIVTCGVPGQRVTSVALEAGTAPPLDDAFARICSRLVERLDARRDRRS